MRWRGAKMEKGGNDYPALIVRDKADLDESGLKDTLLNGKHRIFTFILAPELEPDVYVITLWIKAGKPGEIRVKKSLSQMPKIECKDANRRLCHPHQ